MTVLVLVTEGKHGSVYMAMVRTFPSREDANDFVDITNEKYSSDQKHWVYADIVSDGEVIELIRPEENTTY